MSGRLVSRVHSKVVGTAPRKAVLVCCAAHANDDGSGVWASKQTIANQTEFARSTIIKIINEFVAEGLLVNTGVRKCSNGVTVNYCLNLAALNALPDVPKGVRKSCQKVDPSESRPDEQPDQCTRRATEVRPADCMTSDHRTRTVPEPSLNRPTNALSFSRFWEAWPNKVARARAEKAWRKLASSDRADALKGAENWFSAWRLQHPHAAPIHAATYLSNRRWEDSSAHLEDPRTKQAELVKSGHPLAKALRSSTIRDLLVDGYITVEDCKKAGLGNV